MNFKYKHVTNLENKGLNSELDKILQFEAI